MQEKKQPIIKLRDVWKIYRMGEVEVPALRGIDLDIFQGEFVSIMGPSGSGKSTCMNMVGCLDIPTKGEIFLDSQDISKLHESELAQIRGKKIGFVFQQFNLMPNLTALENVMLPMIFQGVPEKERKERSEKLLNLVGLGSRINHKPSELSGGEQQRVAIARALSNNPKVILADEPTGNLDSKKGKDIMEVLGRLNKDEGKTIIIVTHDKEVAGCGERIVNLMDGRIAEKENHPV